MIKLTDNINLPQGMEIGKVFTGHGFAFKNENLIDVDKDMKDGKFDEKNPQVHIVGYGVMSMKTIRQKLFRVFKELSIRAKKGEIENVNSYIKDSGVLQALVKAYLDAKKQLKSPTMKRKITMYKRKK